LLHAVHRDGVVAAGQIERIGNRTAVDHHAIGGGWVGGALPPEPGMLKQISGDFHISDRLF